MDCSRPCDDELEEFTVSTVDALLNDRRVRFLQLDWRNFGIEGKDYLGWRRRLLLSCFTNAA